MLNFLYNHLWATLLLLGSLHLLDYALTIVGARMYHNQSHFRIEGSYELNPAFQSDVDQLKTLSPKFLLRLSLALLLYAGMWWLVHRGRPGDTLTRGFFEFILGIIIGMLAHLNARHLQNITLFRRMQRPGFTEGSLYYPRPSSYDMSADMMYIQAGLVVLFAGLTLEIFFLGAALMFLVLGTQHRVLASQAAAKVGGAIVAGGRTTVRPKFIYVLLWVVLFLAFMILFMNLPSSR